MAIVNNWVGYFDRSYQQIKDSILSRFTVTNPEVSDLSESNLLVIIINMFAGIAEMLGLYIDNLAREAFISQVRRWSNMVKLTRILDYRIKAMSAASADLNISMVGTPVFPAIIPQFTAFTSNNGITFINLLQVSVPSILDPKIKIGVSQVSVVNSLNIGTTNGTLNQKMSLGPNYVDNTVSLTVDGIGYTYVETFGYSKPTDKHFTVNIEVDGNAYVIFGDGLYGIIPPAFKTVLASFYTSLGKSGNVNENTITNSNLTIVGVTSITINNPLKASGGTDYEDIETIRRNAPLSIRTLDRAVTRQDYKDITLMVPGVGKALVCFHCGKTFDIFIVPSTGSPYIAQSPLIAEVQTVLDSKKMITTFPKVRPAGSTFLNIEMDIAPKFRANPAATQIDVINALVLFGSLPNQDINKPIRLSDILSTVDNLEKVDYINLKMLSTIPYARPMNSTQELLWNRVTKPTCDSKQLIRIEYYDPGIPYLRIFKNNYYITTISLGVTYYDNDVEFTVPAGPYTSGMMWEFVTYPVNKDIALDDKTIPSIDASNIIINIVPNTGIPLC